MEERGKADEAHQGVVELLSKVNEIRGEIRSQHEERERLVKDHNKSVRQALRGPDQNEELADSLTEKLLEGGSVTFGGIVSSGVDVADKQKPKAKRAPRKLRTSRGKKR